MSQTRRLLQAARGRFPIYFTTISFEASLRDASFWATKVPWLECCVAESDAVKIDPCLEAREDEPVIAKKFPSALYETGLVGRLTAAGVDTLIIAGCTTSVCVRATALDAMQHGYRPIVAREAVGDFVPEVHEIHLLDIDSRYADVWAVDDVCAYLTGLAEDQAS